MNEPQSGDQFKSYLKSVANGGILNQSEMRDAIHLILEGKVSDIQAAGFLMALRARGETVQEITAAATAMRDLATPVIVPDHLHDKLIDTAGTGGDGAGTYNISTAAAIIAAGAGATVAKHGNKAATSKSGSSDILAALGVNLQASPKTITHCLEGANVGFMFAAYHHKAVANIANVRSNLGVRTIFNVLGPLTNPAGARRQLIGVFDKALCRPLAEVLQTLGAKKAWIVHGSDGLDEITSTGPTHICALEKGQINEFSFTPEDVDIPIAQPIDLIGGSPEDNAVAFRDLCNGKTGAYRDIAVLNAAAALVIADIAPDMAKGVKLARTSIDSGKALNALTQLVSLSQE